MNNGYKTYHISRITKPYVKKLNFTNKNIRIKTRSHFLPLVGLTKAGQIQGRCAQDCRWTGAWHGRVGALGRAPKL